MPETPAAETAILTIGYGGRTLDEFLQLLCSHAVQYVVDVRSVPYSQHRPEFNRESLHTALADHGIKYLFMGDCLGGRPADSDCYIDGRVDYLRCRSKDWFQAGIKRLQAASAGSHQIVLMCSEGKPENCHRTKLIGEEVVAQRGRVLHIDEKGNSVEHSEVMARLSDPQMGLFEPPASVTMSRKRYDAPREERRRSG